MSLYLHKPSQKELISQVHIGQLLIPNSLIVLAGQGEVTNIEMKTRKIDSYIKTIFLIDQESLK
tara:strand:+ start:80 stop:271 length:192 start_codon:yes stop_codon:yes gene_type:complete